jgi:zinc protease
MRTLIILVFASLGILAAVPLMAAPADDIELTNVEEFDFHGINVILRESREVPSVTVILYVKGGTTVMNTNDEVADEYMAMNLIPGSGSELTSKQYYRRIMLRLGSGIGGSDGRDFSVITMRSTSEHFDTTWKYFADKITHPAVDQVEFNNLQRNALIGLNSGRTNPEQLARLVGDSLFYLNHPYGRRLTRESIESETPDRVLRYFKGIMMKSRLLLVVVGNISRKELQEKMEKGGLGNLPQGNFTMPDLPIPEKSKSPGAIFPSVERKLPTNYVRGYFRIPSKGSPDYYPYVRVRNFLGGFLFQHLRVQTNLSYAPDIDDAEGRESYAVISFETPLVDSAVRMVFRDIDFFQQNLLLESAIKGGVMKYTTSTFLKQESTPEVAGALGQAQILTGSWKNAFVSYDKLANVKAEDLLRVARTYLKNINWVVIGDTRNVDKKLLESR